MKTILFLQGSASHVLYKPSVQEAGYIGVGHDGWSKACFASCDRVQDLLVCLGMWRIVAFQE